VLKKEVWERRSHAFPTYYTPDSGKNRTLTPNISQMPSHAKSSFCSRNYSGKLEPTRQRSENFKTYYSW